MLVAFLCFFRAICTLFVPIFGFIRILFTLKSHKRPKAIKTLEHATPKRFNTSSSRPSSGRLSSGRPSSSSGMHVNTTRRSISSASPASPSGIRLDRIRPASPRVLQLSQPLSHDPILPDECKFSPKINNGWEYVKPRFMEGVDSPKQSTLSSLSLSSTSSSSKSEVPYPAGNNIVSPMNSSKKTKVSGRLKDLARPVMRLPASAQELDRECTFHPKTKFYKKDV